MHGFNRLVTIISNDGISMVFVKLVGKLKSRHFKQLIKRGKWFKATLVGEQLITLFPNNFNYSVELAKCYQEMGNYFRANDIIQKYMDFNFNLNNVVKMLEHEINSSDNIESKYMNLEGNNNCGLIEHKIYTSKSVNKYLTKISQSKHNEMEKLFYNKVYYYFPKIRKITPKLVNIKEIDEANLFILTMDKVEGEKPSLDDQTIHKASKISQTISSIKYSEVYQWFPLIVDKEGHKLIDLLWSFGEIHKEFTNKNLFSFIFKEIDNSDYSKETVKLFKRLEIAIMKNKMYKNLEPMDHYSIQHGDFFQWNLLNDNYSNELTVIDWGLMRIGPTWCDMAGFFGEIRYPFHKIKSNFLSNSEASGHMEPIEKLFFIYTLIAVWFVEFSKDEFEKSHEIYLRPAIELMESMVFNYKERQLA